MQTVISLHSPILVRDLPPLGVVTRSGAFLVAITVEDVVRDKRLKAVLQKNDGDQKGHKACGPSNPGEDEHHSSNHHHLDS